MRILWMWVALLLGCGLAIQHTEVMPRRPVGAQRFPAPPIYRAWFAVAESCTFVIGDFDRLRFYWVPSNPMGQGFPLEFQDSVFQLNGLWTQRGHRIYIAEHELSNPRLVIHEMVHELLNHGDHPDEVFRKRCQLMSS